jgi:hypothetical protein
MGQQREKPFAIIWFTPEQFIRAKSLLAGCVQLPEAYDDMCRQVELTIALCTKMPHGRAVQVPIDPDAFLAWCRRRRQGPTDILLRIYGGEQASVMPAAGHA